MTPLEKIKNIVINGLHPSYLPVMARKVARRWREPARPGDAAACRDWCAAQAEDAAPWARSLDATLWDEAVAYADAHRVYAGKRLTEIGLDLGGGGHYALLYFLTRWKRPAAVLETGVAAGHSSRAILSAIARNGTGALFSSDFPYFRIERPERFVGILVDDDLRGPWTLRIKGDEANLPDLLALAPPIDLFHYDSDKSLAGRRRALDRVRPHLAPDAIVMFDDIQDNAHFREVAQTYDGPVKVFAFEGKYLGVLLPTGFDAGNGAAAPTDPQ